MTLIFVYNADSGLFSTVTDFAHKVMSPDTYKCNLCKITYGNFAINKEWKDFLDALGHEQKFLHRDEFAKAYPLLKDTPLPAIFGGDDDQMALLVSAAEINAVKDVQGMKDVLHQKLKAG